MPRRSSRNSTTAKSSVSKKRPQNTKQSNPPIRAKRQCHQTEEDTARNLTSDDITTILTSILQSSAASKTSNTNESSSIANKSSPSNSCESSTNNAITSGSNNANVSETSAANTLGTSNDNHQADNKSQPRPLTTNDISAIVTSMIQALLSNLTQQGTLHVRPQVISVGGSRCSLCIVHTLIISTPTQRPISSIVTAFIGLATMFVNCVS